VRLAANEMKSVLGDAANNPIMAAAIREAAELGVIASDLRAKWLRGEPVDIAEIVSAENVHRRALGDLGIKPRQREPMHTPLREQLAAETGR
jgi:hypothetical protein